MEDSPLGKTTQYVSEYAPDLLFPIDRDVARSELGLEAVLPFSGVDIWNAWELAWLNSAGKPIVATAEIRVAATSTRLIESKSLKLYLNSLAMMRYQHAGVVQALIQADLERAADGEITVLIRTSDEWPRAPISPMPGRCIDKLRVSCDAETVDADLLQLSGQGLAETVLHSNILRSNCPVTGQPDSGSILVRYRGDEISPRSLLAYLASYRQHNAFHEACVEQIFVDILRRCRPEALTVYAQYNRRGGLDINPFRSNFEVAPPFERCWRQ